MKDTIYRQDVLDGIRDLKRSPWYQGDGYLVRKEAVETVEQLCVKNLPSAQPEKRTETHSCDCISRQAAIEIASGYCHPANIAKELAKLPSAQPERKKGKWIIYIPEHGKCPFCGNQVDLCDGMIHHYCNECGADMRGNQE